MTEDGTLKKSKFVQPMYKIADKDAAHTEEVQNRHNGKHEKNSVPQNNSGENICMDVLIVGASAAFLLLLAMVIMALITAIETECLYFSQLLKICSVLSRYR